MAGGFYDDSDPNAVAGEYEQFPQGEIVVAGIATFVYKDDQGVPYYKERDGRPQTMVRLVLPGGKDGPPMTCTPAQMVLLVQAFAGPAAVKLLPQDRGTSQFLLRAGQLINCKADEQMGTIPARQTAYVGKKGYVSRLNGMNLPTDQFFRFKIVDVRNVDGTTDPIRFMLNKALHQEMVNVRFRVMGDMQGNPTMYDGAEVTVPLDNAFSGTQDTGSGIIPKFKINENRSKPAAAKRIEVLCKVYAPEVADHSWVTDASRSQFGTNEAENPLPVIVHYLLRGERIGVAKMKVAEKSKNKYAKLDILDLVGLDGGSAVSPAAPKAESWREKLFKLVADYVKAVGWDAFEPNTTTLTSTGRTWAKEKLVPVWDALGLSPEHRLTEISEDDAHKLYIALVERYGLPGKPPEEREF